jgi:hypothetical protein
MNVVPPYLPFENVAYGTPPCQPRHPPRKLNPPAYASHFKVITKLPPKS